MADPAHCQDVATWKVLLSSLGPSFAVGLAALLGLVLLRRQELVKRHVEHAAGVRKLQLDALVQIVEAVGRYYIALERHRFYRGEANRQEDDSTLEQERAFRAAKDEEEQAFHSLMETIGRKGPLLGGAAASVVDAARGALISSTSAEESLRIMTMMEGGIAPWVPPLEPVQPATAPARAPWLGPAVILMLEAAVIVSIFWR